MRNREDQNCVREREKEEKTREGEKDEEGKASASERQSIKFSPAIQSLFSRLQQRALLIHQKEEEMDLSG
jgi:hypothetical protein